MLCELVMVDKRNGRRVVLTPASVETEESGAMENYEVLNDEACGAVRVGRIECAAGCGGATLKMDGHAPDAVLFYASVAEALAAVRLYYGYANAYLHKVREVAA